MSHRMVLVIRPSIGAGDRPPHWHTVLMNISTAPAPQVSITASWLALSGPSGRQRRPTDAADAKA